MAVQKAAGSVAVRCPARPGAGSGEACTCAGCAERATAAGGCWCGLWRRRQPQDRGQRGGTSYYCKAATAMRSAPNSPKLCCAVPWGCPGIWWYMWTAQGTLAPYWGRAHAVVRAGAAWAANGAVGAAQCELFQCLCAQPPSRAGSPGGTYTMCESKIHTKVTRRVCCGLFWKYGRFTRIERFLTVDMDLSS